ncbi:MAG: hypothetical protein HYY13_04130 [Nitrospirae bacterium]|nr:hypothetical protein [Nitrospirota bacterium]
MDGWDKNAKSRFIKACRLASVDLSHPSLHTKKVVLPDGSPAIRCRIDDFHRIHFNPPTGGQLRIREVGGHRLEGIG